MRENKKQRIQSLYNEFLDKSNLPENNLSCLQEMVEIANPYRALEYTDGTRTNTHADPTNNFLITQRSMDKAYQAINEAVERDVTKDLKGFMSSYILRATVANIREKKEGVAFGCTAREIVDGTNESLDNKHYIKGVLADDGAAREIFVGNVLKEFGLFPELKVDMGMTSTTFMMATLDIKTNGYHTLDTLNPDFVKAATLDLDSLAKLKLLEESIDVSDITSNPGNIAVNQEGHIRIIDFKTGNMGEDIPYRPYQKLLKNTKKAFSENHPGESFDDMLNQRKELLKDDFKIACTNALTSLGTLQDSINHHNALLKDGRQQHRGISQKELEELPRIITDVIIKDDPAFRKKLTEVRHIDIKDITPSKETWAERIATDLAQQRVSGVPLPSNPPRTLG